MSLHKRSLPNPSPQDQSPPKHSPQTRPTPRPAPGQRLFYTCLGLAMTAGLSVALWPYLLWGAVTISLDMGWSTWGDATTTTPWDGCVPPATATERDQWVADAAATNTPLCNEDIVDMEFPEVDLSSELLPAELEMDSVAE